MRSVQFLLSGLLVVLGGAAQASGGSPRAQVALTLEFYADQGAGGIYLQNAVPKISCAIEHRFAYQIELGPHDIYLGVWRPDGSWQTAVGDISTGYRLQNGFTPIAPGLVPPTREPIRLIDTMQVAISPFNPLTDPPGIYYGFCLAVLAGEPVVDLKNVRNITMVPFYWEGRKMPPDRTPQ